MGAGVFLYSAATWTISLYQYQGQCELSGLVQYPLGRLSRLLPDVRLYRPSTCKEERLEDLLGLKSEILGLE